MRSKRAWCAGAVARLIGMDRTTDFLSVEVSMNAGIGGTGGGGDAMDGLGGGERKRADDWPKLRLVVRDGELERIGSDDIEELLLLPKARLRAPKSSSSPKRPSFAFLSKRSCDLDAFKVF